MFSSAIQAWARRLVERLLGPLRRGPITPNMLTLLGFLLNAGVAAVLASGHLVLGGAFVLLAGAFDLLDGGLARARGMTSAFGAFLDSTVDRYSESVIFLGLLIYYLGRPAPMAGVLLLFVATVGSLMVSYARARAEGLQLECKVGLLARPERVVILALGLLATAFWSPALLAGLAFLAFATNATAVQRMVHVYRVTHRPTEREESTAPEQPEAPRPRLTGVGRTREG